MKRLTALLLALTLVFSLGVTASAAGTTVAYAVTGGSVYFDTATGTITNCDEAVTRADIPASINGVAVTSIGASAFSFCKNLTEVTIPDSVTSIHSSAFSFFCRSLTSIKVDPRNQRYCDEDGIVFSKDLTEIVCFPGGHAQTAYKIPDGVTTIGACAFIDCDNLTSVTIPDSVTSIGGSAFSYCDNLTSITVPNRVVSIGETAFSNSGLTSVTIPDSVTSISDGMFANCGSLTRVTIPNSVVTIGEYAFHQSGLTSITIPSSVTSIADHAFTWCAHLTEAAISSSVTSIGMGAFAGCISLAEVYYGGSEVQWNRIEIGNSNEPLLNAAIHYNSEISNPVRFVAYASTQNVLIDGQSVELQAYALKDENGNPTNYVKLRDVAYALSGTAAQFEVGWDGSVNILTGQAYTPNGTEMSTPFSGDRAYTVPDSVTNIDGAAADLAAIYLTDDSGGGYTYYQLRDLGKALGFNVGWSNERGIFIETDKPYSDLD